MYCLDSTDSEKLKILQYFHNHPAQTCFSVSVCLTFKDVLRSLLWCPNLENKSFECLLNVRM